MRARACTETVDKVGVALVVEEYRCLDKSLLGQIGAQTEKKRSWKVRAVGVGEDSLSPCAEHGHMAPSVLIEAVVDRGLGGVRAAALGSRVRVCADDKQLFPSMGDKARMFQDLRHEWNFRGVVSGLGLVGPGEPWIPGTLPTDAACAPTAQAMQDAILGPSALRSLYEVEVGGQRFPAVITKQQPDGCFGVTAFRPDERGMVQCIDYPSMDRSAIFLAGETAPVIVPERLLALEVTQANPQGMTLTIDGKSFNEFLGRVSPKVSTGASPPRISMDVPKRPKKLTEQVGAVLVALQESEAPISVNVGASILSHFISGQVRSGDFGASRLEKWWTVHLGPFAEHKIKIEKKNRFSPIMTLSVDDEVLAECSGDDLGCPSDEWRVKFTMFGERHIDFNVCEETRDGVQLESKSVVTRPYSYKHTIEVAYQRRKVDDLTSAVLTIDGVTFSDLNFMVSYHDQANMSVTREVLELSHGIQVPRKVVAQDTRSTARKIAGRVWEEWKGPMNDVMTRKADETGAMMSHVGSEAYKLLSLQKSAWFTAPLCTRPETEQVETI